MVTEGSSERARLVGAMTEMVAASGFEGVSVSGVCERAGVREAVFGDWFADCEECFLAAFDEVVARGAVRVLDGCGEAEDWVERVGLGLRAMLCFFDEERCGARLAVVESFGVSRYVLWRRSRVLDWFVEIVHEGGCAALAPDDREPGVERAREVVLSVHGVVHESLASGNTRPLAPLAGMLASIVVSPYLRQRAAGLGVGAQAR